MNSETSSANLDGILEKSVERSPNSKFNDISDDAYVECLENKDYFEAGKTEMLEGIPNALSDGPMNERAGSEASTPGVSDRASFPELSSTTKIPGWKGWLRTASSSNFRSSSRPDSIARASTLSSRSPDKSKSHARPALLDMFTLAKESSSVSSPDHERIDWDFFEGIVQNNEFVDSPTIRIAIRAGFPGQLRSIIWQTLLESKSIELGNVFSELHGSQSEFEKQIKKDVGRMGKAWQKALNIDVSLNSGQA